MSFNTVAKLLIDSRKICTNLHKLSIRYHVIPAMLCCTCCVNATASHVQCKIRPLSSVKQKNVLNVAPANASDT